MSNSEGNDCYGCTHWDKLRTPEHEGGEEWGECRRRAPMVFRTEPDEGQPTRTAWPRTMAYDWCGEFVQHFGKR